MIVMYLQANFYIKNRGGFAPLHLCCQNGHNETCRVLLLNGCKPDIKNNVSEFIEKKAIDLLILSVVAVRGHPVAHVGEVRARRGD